MGKGRRKGGIGVGSTLLGEGGGGLEESDATLPSLPAPLHPLRTAARALVCVCVCVRACVRACVHIVRLHQLRAAPEPPSRCFHSHPPRSPPACRHHPAAHLVTGPGSDRPVLAVPSPGVGPPTKPARPAVSPSCACRCVLWRHQRRRGEGSLAALRPHPPPRHTRPSPGMPRSGGAGCATAQSSAARIRSTLEPFYTAEGRETTRRALVRSITPLYFHGGPPAPRHTGPGNPDRPAPPLRQTNLEAGRARQLQATNTNTPSKTVTQTNKETNIHTN